MQIERVRIQNFRCFEENEFSFHPEFNLLVGVNGTGKTSILDALSIAQATWLIGLRNKTDHRSILTGEPRLSLELDSEEKRYVEQYPVVIETWGKIQSQEVHWIRSKDSETGKTRYGQASQLIAYAKEADQAIREGSKPTLPLIAYYGTMRLWQEPKDFQKSSKITNPEILMAPHKLSYFEAYRYSVDPRISISNQVAWFARQAWIAFQDGKETWAFEVMREALLSCIEGAQTLNFDPKRGELMLKIKGQDPQPYANLSDGQRIMLALIADLVQKAIWLNPHLSKQVLKKVEGVVLIDELDLHLHPQWQRHVIQDLRRIFPRLQFICTTHSPQLLGQAKAEEIILLKSDEAFKHLDETNHPSQSYGMDSNWILRHVMDSFDRDPQVSSELDRIFELIDEAHLDDASEMIQNLREKIGEHPELVEAEALISHYTRFSEE